MRDKIARVLAPYVLKWAPRRRLQVLGGLNLRAIRALQDEDVAGCIRQAMPGATLACSDEEIEKLLIKEEACLYLGIAFLQGLGQLDDAVFWWRERNRVAGLIARHYLTHYGVALDMRKPIFDHFWSAHIGHTAVLGIHAKRNLLEGAPYTPQMLVRAPTPNPGNWCLVEHFRKYFTLIEGPADLPFPAEHSRYICKNMYLEPRLLGPETYYWQVYAEISKAWEEAGGGALLKLSEAELKRGRRALAAMGIPRGAWYVCLHVRARGYKGHHEGLHDALNADIEAYQPAIDAIVERGGWVIRMGDRSMPKLPRRRGVVDYAHSAHKAAWMDIFLCGTCWFYVGTSSGLAYVPNLFGIPAVFTNWFPIGTRPLNSSDLFIPKMHWYEQDYHFAPFLESLAPPLGHVHIRRTLQHLGVVLRDNTSEDIRDVVVEMMDRLEAKSVYTTEDRQLQSAFNATATRARCHGNARLGRDFLRKYRSLLPATLAHARSTQGFKPDFEAATCSGD